MNTEGMFCFEDEYVGCVCGWCDMTEEEMRASLEEPCGHTEVYPNGYCADCGEPIEDFEPSDAQIPGSYEIGKAVA